MMQMNPGNFEVFCAVLWSKQGSSTVYLAQKSEDGEVAVVAIMGKAGNLI